MRTRARPRHYLSPAVVAMLRPLFRYSVGRDAYVLRLIGHRAGPVLKIDRRRGQRTIPGPDRRRVPDAHRAPGESQATFM